MSKYLIIYNAAESAKDLMASSSPEQMQAGMKEWLDWKAEADKTVKLEFGLPLNPIGRVTPAGKEELNSQVSGHSFIEVDSADAVFQVLANHPQLKRPGASIDIYELIAMPGLDA